LILRSPSNIFGNSEGLMGSIATFIAEMVLNCSGLKMQASALDSRISAKVAVLVMLLSTPYEVKYNKIMFSLRIYEF